MQQFFSLRSRLLLMVGLLLSAATVPARVIARPAPVLRCFSPIEGAPASVGTSLAPANGPASIVLVSATVNSSQQVPANNSTATGTFAGSVNTVTRVMTYTITYAGLAPAAAHIHRGGPGRNGSVILPFTVRSSPITGTATLLQADIDSLLAGRMYVNIHTPAFPGGEIRGNITQSTTGTAPEAVQPSLTLYPNPAHELVALSGLATYAAPIGLLDNLSRVVRTASPLPNGTATLDVRGLPAGLYTVRIGGTVRRLVVE